MLGEQRITRQPRLLIIIPAYNEADNICRVVDDLIEHYPQFDYIVVNDGSRDETAELCRKHGYRLLDLPVNLGLEGAFQAGMRYARAMDYDYAIQFDGDGQHDPAYISDMLTKAQETQADIVIGSRFKAKKKPRSMRMLGNDIIELAVTLTTRHRLTDPTSGMRLFSRRMIRCFSSQTDYGPEPDAVAFLIRCGARVEEIQVEMRERIAGESYLNWSHAISYMMRMTMSILFFQWFRRKIRLEKKPADKTASDA